MNSDLFSIREKEIFKTLKALTGSEFVVIGGYAVNAYTLARFSVDCDIVVADNDKAERIRNTLSKTGYQQLHEAKISIANLFYRYEKQIDNNFAVSMDILVGKVIDRMSGSEFDAEWVLENSSINTLRGKTLIEELRVRTINIDALITMKIVSCRSTDIRDVFMLIPNAKDKKWIREQVSLRQNFREQLNKIIQKVTSKQFKDGLAGVYGSIDPNVFERHLKAISSLAD